MPDEARNQTSLPPSSHHSEPRVNVNPYQSPESELERPVRAPAVGGTNPGRSWQELLEIAIALRRYGWVSLLLMPLSIACVWVGLSTKHLGWLGLTGVGVCCLAQGFVLTQMVRVIVNSARMRVFLILAGCIPVLGSFVVESGSSACVRELREHGLVLGRLGPGANVMRELRLNAQQGLSPPLRMGSIVETRAEF